MRHCLYTYLNTYIEIMKNNSLKLIGYLLLAAIILYIPYLLLSYITQTVLCAACFMTVYGSSVALYFYIIFILFIIYKLYQKKFKQGNLKGMSFLTLIMITAAAYFVITIALIIAGDFLGVGGPYNSF